MLTRSRSRRSTSAATTTTTADLGLVFGRVEKKRNKPASSLKRSLKNAVCTAKKSISVNVSCVKPVSSVSDERYPYEQVESIVRSPVSVAQPLSPFCLSTDTEQEAPAQAPVAESVVNITEDTLSLAYRPTGPLVGRVEEAAAIKADILKLSSSNSESGSLYISGLPGTGKTLVVSRVVNELAVPIDHNLNDVVAPSSSSENKMYKLWVNCANLSKAKDIFPHIAEELGIPLTNGAGNAVDDIRRYARSDGAKIILVLDEVDFLTSRDQTVLYAAFEWAKGVSRFIVIGIANALDLPTRLLPWLRAGNCMPNVHAFAPYTARALQAIVQQRLSSQQSCTHVSPDEPSLHANAVLLASKKIASCSGDARLVLDVCREALSSLRASGSSGAASIGVVSKIVSSRGGTCAVVDTIRELPVQQQLALVVAANATRSAQRKKATLGGLHESFDRICSRAKVTSLNFADFADICANALAHHALLDVVSPTGKARGKGLGVRALRARQVRLRVSVEDVRAGVADKGFLPFLVETME